MLFDLLRECDVFRRHCGEGKIGFKVNYVLAGKPQKTLDLVICRASSDPSTRSGRTFSDLVQAYGVQLTADEAQLLATLPMMHEEQRDDMSEALIAVEAKACMTEHGKSLPRLFAEILATGFLAKYGAQVPITATYNLVNAAPTFKTPSNGRVNVHRQPQDAWSVVEMIREAIPTTNAFQYGYDAIGVTVISCANDNSPVVLIDGPPAPASTNHHHYERMIRSLCSAYRNGPGKTM